MQLTFSPNLNGYKIYIRQYTKWGVVEEVIKALENYKMRWFYSASLTWYAQSYNVEPSQYSQEPLRLKKSRASSTELVIHLKLILWYVDWIKILLKLTGLVSYFKLNLSVPSYGSKFTVTNWHSVKMHEGMKAQEEKNTRIWKSGEYRTLRENSIAEAL